MSGVITGLGEPRVRQVSVLGPDYLNWVAREGSDLYFSLVEGSESVPGELPCSSRGTLFGSLSPGVGSHSGGARAKRREKRKLT